MPKDGGNRRRVAWQPLGIVQSKQLSGAKLTMGSVEDARWDGLLKDQVKIRNSIAAMIYPLPLPFVAGVPFREIASRAGPHGTKRRRG
jgi:hypothetical protein